MKFEEFKRIIQERKQTLKNAELAYERFNQDNSTESINEYMQHMTKSKELEQSLVKESDANKNISFNEILIKVLKVPAQEFETIVVEHLGKSNPCYFYQYDSGSRKVFEINGKKHYLHYKDSIVLTCLAKNDNMVSSILNDCPELEEVLWNLVKSNVKVVNEKQRETLIQRMINLQAEIDFLSNPKQIDNKIEEDRKEKQQCKKEWEDLSKGNTIIL